ncbi:DUF1389 domain-containing protein [Chlamydia buteonis]|uniref:DUF1389 domain-containing protein n=1 Tax=Chlamydia buteonis TaxID=2494525 RepID=UPI00344D1494
MSRNVDSLVVRYRQYVCNSPEPGIRNLNLDKELFAKHLLLLAKHGFSLPGLRLLRCLTLEQVLTLQDLTTGLHGNQLSKWMKSFGNAIYDPECPHAQYIVISVTIRLFSGDTVAYLVRIKRAHGVGKSNAEFTEYLVRISGRPIVISDSTFDEAEERFVSW